MLKTKKKQKNIIADNIHPYLKKIKPTKPGLKSKKFHFVLAAFRILSFRSFVVVFLSAK